MHEGGVYFEPYQEWISQQCRVTPLIIKTDVVPQNVRRSFDYAYLNAEVAADRSAAIYLGQGDRLFFLTSYVFPTGNVTRFAFSLVLYGGQHIQFNVVGAVVSESFNALLIGREYPLLSNISP